MSASAQRIDASDYALKPHDTPLQILNDLPGLVAVQHQGGGKAPQYLIRGFDADHGTDFAVFADGEPVNLVSHAHGQGYADVNFIIPETIDHLELTKGPYYAQYGDFDDAGALNFVSKDEVPENSVHAEGGSWDYQRYVALASPRLLPGVRTLLAGQLYFANGPFISPEHDQRYNSFSKFSYDPSPNSTLSLSNAFYYGLWNGSGQIPLREVSLGLFDRFGSVDPHEGGNTTRDSVNLLYAYTPTPNDAVKVHLYFTRYKLDLFSDFTFFKDTGLRFIGLTDGQFIDTRNGPIVPSANYIPGDGIEQNDSRIMYGGDASYTRSWTLRNRPVSSAFGFQTRSDDIDLGLYRQALRRRFFTVNKTHVIERSFSGYTQHEIIFNEWLRLVAGLRGDFFVFTAHNHLPIQAPDPNFEPVPIDGHTTASIVSPKASIIASPIRDTDLYFNFGTGFHSNDARDAILTANTDISPLSRSIGWEVGARTLRFDRLELQTAFWFLDLDSELVFSGDAGNQEIGGGGVFVPSAATRRWGIDFQSKYRLLSWLSADYDLFYADPRFRSSGAAIPLAPTLLMDGDLTVETQYGFSAGLRIRFLNDRPANEDRSLIARGYTMIDLIGKYRWRNVEASLQFLNITNHDWREAQFADTSCTRNEIGMVAGCAAMPGQQTSHPLQPPQGIHFTPGNPFTVIGGMTVYF